MTGPDAVPPDRLALVLATLGSPGAPDRSADDLRTDLDRLVGSDATALWLAHAVIAGRLPTDVEVTEMVARATLAGTWDALAPALAALEAGPRHREVRVVTDAVLVEADAPEQVARETIRRWAAGRPVELVTWADRADALRPLRADERARLVDPPDDRTPSGPEPVLVPWRCTLVVTRVAADRGRAGRLLALGRHSRNRVGAIGFDLAPLTSAADVDLGATSTLVRHLAAVRRFDRVAPVSPAAEQQLRGWVQMGAGRRDDGPASSVVALPVLVPASTPADLDEATAGLALDPRTPLVLVVGDHEPAANHLAVLHVAERLWREGRRFDLVLVGGPGARPGPYDAALGELQAAGRPVRSIPPLPDRLLGAAYRLAHCTLHPGLDAGPAVPVAASLAAGTPVVTSAFGSMRDVAAPAGAPRGALLVDPRDDDALTDALRTLLIDTSTYERLREEAAGRPTRSWDDYAAELWDYLVDGVVPGGTR